MKLRPTKGKRWRVSAYPPGIVAAVPSDPPLEHRASREQATAQAHFNRLAAQIGKGQVGRVIMHQGKLYTGYSQYIHADTRWGVPVGGRVAS